MVIPEGEPTEIPQEEEFSSLFQDALKAEEEEPEPEIEPEPEPEPEPTPEPEPEPKDKDIEQQYSSLKGMFDQLSQQNKELQEKLTSLSSRPEPTPEPEIAPDEDLKNFAEEYDYIYSPVKKIVDQALEGLVGKLAPTLGEITRQVHENTIIAHHPDFTKYRDSGELETWAKGTGSAVDIQVYEKGDTKAVVDLVDRFREAKGYRGYYLADEKKGEPEPEPEAKSTDARTQPLTVVKTKHSGAGGDEGNPGKVKADKNDFSSAFKEALKQSMNGR
jgi:hypothetical protein